jgi:hypothetical protein
MSDRPATAGRTGGSLQWSALASASHSRRHRCPGPRRPRRRHGRRHGLGGLAGPATAGVSASHARTTDFGYLTRLRTTKKGTTLALDRAILYTGSAAAAERAKRGLEPDVSDFYIANDNPRLRTYRVAPGVVVRGSQLLTGSPEAKTVPLSTLRRHLEQRTKGSSSVPFTLTFDRRGRVAVIEEMYLS